MRSRWPFVVGVGCVAFVALTAFRPGGHPIGWRQTNEADGWREPEYGVFGATLYQPHQPVAGLRVAGDFRAEIAQAGLKSPTLVEAQFGKAVRTVRREGTQYWLWTDLSGGRRRIADGYAAQLKPCSRFPLPSGGETIEGTCPDGRTHVRFLFDPRASKSFDFLLTFGPGG